MTIEKVAEKRTLTDADVAAIIEQAEKRFYTHLGRGIWAIVWKAILLGLVAIAASAYIKDVK